MNASKISPHLKVIWLESSLSIGVCVIPEFTQPDSKVH